MEEALIALLIGDGGLAALVGARVHGGSRPQGSGLPAVVIARIGGAPLYSDEGEVGLDQARMQVDCWGESYASAKLTARAVRRVLSGFEGTVGGITIQFIMLDAERDFREGGANSAEYLFRTTLDFLIWTET
jgi:hypothetical protein